MGFQAMQLCLLFSLFVEACTNTPRNPEVYGWMEIVGMPAKLSRKEQMALADCVVHKIATPELKSDLRERFANISPEWINGIQVTRVDAKEIIDLEDHGIQVWVQMPGSKEASVTPSPVVAYVVTNVRAKINVCADELKFRID